MNFTCENKTKCFWSKQAFCLMMWLSLVLSPPFGKAGLVAENESIQHYKMLSAVEYTGKGQFRSQAETLCTVRRQPLSEDKVLYFLSAKTVDPAGDNPDSEGQLLFEELSFVIDRKTRHLSGVSSDMVLLEKVNNRCVSSLKKITNRNIGKTWKQSFDLSFLSNTMPGELKFTLTALRVDTKAFGEMIVVRALSEPFVVQIPITKGGVGPVKSTIRAVYVFDPEIEDIYMSISVFEATTNINGFKEKLRHEVATYRTDATGVSADFSGLDKNFEKLVRKLGMTRKSLKVVKATLLPQWARSEGLVTSQVANICVATACEGSINPVATVCISAARTIAMQSAGTLVTYGEMASVSSLLAKSVPGIGAMKIAVAPAFMGVGLGTAGVAAGGTVGAVAIAGGGSSGGSSSRSPSQ